MKPRILIVDDDELVCDLYGDYFEQNGFEISSAINVEAALNFIRKETPDIILSDVVMPYRDGFSLYEEVKMFYPDIPIVFMTGYENDPDIVNRLKKYGKKWFTKPIKLDEMLEIVRSELSAQTQA
ncbi:MAG: response regulator [Candidatus Neomarinimicrobiota bacterium]